MTAARRLLRLPLAIAITAGLVLTQAGVRASTWPDPGMTPAAGARLR